jgi:DNA ligase (NAD+)
LGEELVRDFLDHSVIRDPADLYAVTVEQLLSLPNFKEKSANNVVQAIERSKDRPLPNVIFALGIRHVGGQTADLLSQAFGNLDALASASTDQLEATEGVGPKIAESIAAWFQGEGNRAFLERLHLAGVTWQDERSSEATGPLNGITFLITGRLDSLSRGHAEEQLKELGAKIASSVNKGVDYLIVGAEPGSKLAKAQKLGTKIRDEEWLVRLFENGAIVDA